MNSIVVCLAVFWMPPAGVAWQAVEKRNVDAAAGELGIPLGRTATLEGFIVEGFVKSAAHGPNLVVQRIDGRGVQRQIVIPISPAKKVGEGEVPEFQTGSTYRVLARETRVVFPRAQEVGEERLEKADKHPFFPNFQLPVLPPLQEWGEQSQNYLRAISGRKIAPIVWSPADFVGREALLEGTAANVDGAAALRGDGWRIMLDGAEPWGEDELGKRAESFGTVVRGDRDGVFQINGGRNRLVELQDQLGKTVKLRGVARSLNNHWWFNYRGTNLYVDKMQELPGGGPGHWQEIEVTGVLGRGERPNVRLFGMTGSKYPKPYFVVCDAAWEPVDELLSPEMDRRDGE